MDIISNPDIIDLQNLINISRGDRNRALQYLHQFQELIPQRIVSLKDFLEQGDRKMIRQTLHQMSPQLQFFGIPEVFNPIQSIELEYKTLSIQQLTKIVGDILIKLELATKEVDSILTKYF